MNNSTLGMLILAFIAVFGAISFFYEFFRGPKGTGQKEHR